MNFDYSAKRSRGYCFWPAVVSVLSTYKILIMIHPYLVQLASRTSAISRPVIRNPDIPHLCIGYVRRPTTLSFWIFITIFKIIYGYSSRFSGKCLCSASLSIRRPVYSGAVGICLSPHSLGEPANVCLRMGVYLCVYTCSQIYGPAYDCLNLCAFPFYKRLSVIIGVLFCE